MDGQTQAHTQNDNDKSPSQMNFSESSWFCANEVECGKKAVTRGVPEGWYIVRRSRGEHLSLTTASIVCSVQCLVVDASMHTAKLLRQALKMVS